MAKTIELNQLRVLEALRLPALVLGVLPEWASLRPKLDVRVYQSLDSTNQEAWRLIAQGCGAGTAVIAQVQSAGRGQWGRQWLSANGGLYLSLILEPEMAIADTLLLTLASAWGIATSLENLGMALQIKWPNDLVSHGRKLGGILTECRSRALPPSPQSTAEPGVQFAVVGVGVNWDNPLPEKAISLRQLLPDRGVSPVKDLETLAAIVLRGILQGYYHLRQRGSASLIQAYEHKLSHLGKRITVCGHAAIVQGVTHSGDLKIEMLYKTGQNSIQTLKPGEISLGYNV